MIKARSASGNMLFLVVLTIGTILALCIAGLMLSRFLCQCSRAQATGDSVAAELASDINKSNRVGQINELEAFSRELVYLSRQRYKTCAEKDDASFLEPLCYELLTEARAGQRLVEEERQNQIKSICAELEQSALNYNTSAEAAGLVTFFGLQTSEPLIDDIEIGSIKNSESNVRNPVTISSLAEFDRSNKYVDINSNLFRANIDAKIPEDADLDFKISSLAANVEGTCAAARNVNPNVFVPSGTIMHMGEIIPSANADQIPNAVQVKYKMNASVSARDRAIIPIVSTGVTSGDAKAAP